MKSNIELLAPVGTTEALVFIGEGADAIYLGLRDFNARARAKNFSYKQFEAIVEKVHDQNKKVFVTVNTVFEERETNIMYNFLKYLAAVKPDGIIAQDLGVIQMANTYFPDLILHASTQMNVSSSEGVNFLSKHNVKRVVLSRELTYEQIKASVKQQILSLSLCTWGAASFLACACFLVILEANQPIAVVAHKLADECMAARNLLITNTFFHYMILHSLSISRSLMQSA